MALPLPDSLFSALPSTDAPLSVEGNVGDSIDSGELDLTPILEKNDTGVPSDTIKGASEAFYQQQAKVQSEKANTQPQTNQSSDQLDKIEAAIANIDEKIGSLKPSAQPAQQNRSAATDQSKIDESLVKNETDDGSVVEVVKKESTVTNNKSVTDRASFTKEKINELLEQRNMLIQERQKILSTGVMNTLTNNQTANIDNSKSEITQGGPNASNTTTTDLNNSLIQNTTNNQEGSSQSTASNNTQISNTDSITNQQQDNNQIFNDSMSQIENTDVDARVSESPITNIENKTVGDTINEGSINNATSFLPQPENETGELPSPKSEMNVNSENIAQILNGIKQGIDSLPEKLGSNFQRLGSTLDGIKSTVINNQYNSSQNSFAGGQSAPSQGGEQRSVAPDYNTELPNANDFPPNFDMASLGGTNLPNPQFVT